MSIRSQKTFVLGVGAQKAGTSWLHHQLASRADTDFGFLKEYHVFDVIFHSEYEYFRPKRVAPWKWRTRRRNKFINKPEYYFNYFEKRLNHKSVLLTGDITPSYACLTPQTYQLIRSEFEKRKILLRAVFLMRDPIERFLSQHRMQLRKMGKLKPEHEADYLGEASIKLLKRNCLRSNYPKTIDSLRAGLNTDEVFFSLYETMFSNSEHRRLCHFLNIEAVKPNTTARINASPATTCVPEEVMSRLGRHFGQLIKDVDTRCPELRVREFWKTTEKWSRSPLRNDAK